MAQRSNTGSRPIIVRFFDREKRDEVLSNRRNLKRKVFVVGEDLTYANYQVSKKAMEHSATLAVWSSNGRILARVKNGRIVRLNIHTDLDEVFKRVRTHARTHRTQARTRVYAGTGTHSQSLNAHMHARTHTHTRARAYSTVTICVRMYRSKRLL